MENSVVVEKEGKMREYYINAIILDELQVAENYDALARKL